MSFRIDPPIREVVSGVPTHPSPGRASCALDFGVFLWTGRAFLMEGLDLFINFLLYVMPIIQVVPEIVWEEIPEVEGGQGCVF